MDAVAWSNDVRMLRAEVALINICTTDGCVARDSNNVLARGRYDCMVAQTFDLQVSPASLPAASAIPRKLGKVLVTAQTHCHCLTLTD